MLDMQHELQRLKQKVACLQSPAAPKKNILLFVRSPTQLHELRVCTSSTVWDVKALIQGKEGIPAFDQRVLFDGQMLLNDKPLSAINGLADGDTIDMIPPQNGC